MLSVSRSLPLSADSGLYPTHDTRFPAFDTRFPAASAGPFPTPLPSSTTVVEHEADATNYEMHLHIDENKTPVQNDDDEREVSTASMPAVTMQTVPASPTLSHTRLQRKGSMGLRSSTPGCSGGSKVHSLTRKQSFEILQETQRTPSATAPSRRRSARCNLQQKIEDSGVAALPSGSAPADPSALPTLALASQPIAPLCLESSAPAPAATTRRRLELREWLVVMAMCMGAFRFARELYAALDEQAPLPVGDWLIQPSTCMGAFKFSRELYAALDEQALMAVGSWLTQPLVP